MKTNWFRIEENYITRVVFGNIFISNSKHYKYTFKNYLLTGGYCYDCNNSFYFCNCYSEDISQYEIITWISLNYSKDKIEKLFNYLRIRSCDKDILDDLRVFLI